MFAASGVEAHIAAILAGTFPISPWRAVQAFTGHPLRPPHARLQQGGPWNDRLILPKIRAPQLRALKDDDGDRPSDSDVFGLGREATMMQGSRARRSADDGCG